MKVGIFADGIWGLNTIKILFLDKNFKIDFIVLRKKKDLKIVKFCKQKKIIFFCFNNVNSKKSINTLKKFNSELLVSMSYNQIFKKNFIKFAKKKLINCHAGALPFYRGRSPINSAIINGENKIGITTHLVSYKIDQGDILDQEFIKINKKDNFKSILRKCYKHCPIQLYRVIKKFKYGTIKAIKQSSISKKGTYYYKRKKGDELINFNNNFEKLDNFIRGLVFPSVGATFYFKRSPYVTLRTNFSAKISKNNNIINGTILNVSKKKLKIKILDSTVYFSNIFSKKNKCYLDDYRKIFKKNFLLKGKNA
tara:strand:+ start:1111 stop:2037 length:927 start_codon:yes stop_codon:yes gene_type:complete